MTVFYVANTKYDDKLTFIQHCKRIWKL